MAEKSPFVVDADWLQGQLGTPGLSIVDASWYLPAQGRDAKAEYKAAHIPGAMFFDQDVVVDPDSDLPHTLPRPEIFARMPAPWEFPPTTRSSSMTVRECFPRRASGGCFASWALRSIILDGGFDSWKKPGVRLRRSDQDRARASSIRISTQVRVAGIEDVRGIVESGERQIADARPAGRFAGEDPEPRKGVRSGHMPGAKTCRRLRCPRTAICCRSTNCAASWSTPGSISTSRSSHLAARASRQR